MQVIRYKPFNEIQKLQRDFNKIWDEGLESLPDLQDWSTMDLYEEDGNLVAELLLPNFKKEEIRATIQNGYLEVIAEQTDSTQDTKNRKYYKRESSTSLWRRTALPKGIKEEQVDASYENGLLKITIPMDSEDDQQNTKDIQIK